MSSGTLDVFFQYILERFTSRGKIEVAVKGAQPTPGPNFLSFHIGFQTILRADKTFLYF